MLKYKITDNWMRTRNGFQYRIGEVVGVPRPWDEQQRLCGPGYLHWFHHPGFAQVTWAFYGNYGTSEAPPRLWECEPSGQFLLDFDKGGSRELRLVRELPLTTPTVATVRRILRRCLVMEHLSENLRFAIESCCDNLDSPFLEIGAGLPYGERTIGDVFLATAFFHDKPAATQIQAQLRNFLIRGTSDSCENAVWRRVRPPHEVEPIILEELARQAAGEIG